MRSIENGLRIERLANHPEVIPVLVAWFKREWSSYYGADGPSDAGEDLRAFASGEGLPVGVVAFCDGELCGTAALKAESIRTRAHFGPWVAAGLVAPEYRRKGIGAALVGELETIARDMGYPAIYSGTESATGILDRRGWEFLERLEYDGQEISIYRLEL